MAHFRKTATGWRAEIERQGIRLTKGFATKKAAELWAMQQERAILDGEVSRWPRKTVQDAFERYADEVTPTKGSAKAESLRLAAFVREFPAIAGKQLSEVTPADIAGWRDAMLKRVTPGTVKRMANSYRSVWTLARKEWGWCGDSPWASVKLPADNPPRDRLAGWREIRRILRRCDYVTHYPPVSGLQNVAWAWLLSLRTAMRAGEVLSLTTADVAGSVVTLQQHKTRHITGKARRVPLTPQGARLVAELMVFAQALGRGRLFSITSASLEAQFRDAVAGLMIHDLHYHDSRGTALTHLAKRVGVLDLAKISGHRDIRLLSQVYYRDDATEIAARLARPTQGHRRPAIA